MRHNPFAGVKCRSFLLSDTLFEQSSLKISPCISQTILVAGVHLICEHELPQSFFVLAWEQTGQWCAHPA